MCLAYFKTYRYTCGHRSKAQLASSTACLSILHGLMLAPESAPRTCVKWEPVWQPINLWYVCPECKTGKVRGPGLPTAAPQRDGRKRCQGPGPMQRGGTKRAAAATGGRKERGSRVADWIVRQALYVHCPPNEDPEDTVYE